MSENNVKLIKHRDTIYTQSLLTALMQMETNILIL